MAPWSHASDRVVTHMCRHCADFVTHGRDTDTRKREPRHTWPPHWTGIGGADGADEEIARFRSAGRRFLLRQADDEPIRSDLEPRWPTKEGQA